MALNAYSICPLGSGKKIKFCCPREHLADYLKVFELMEAEQFAAASALTDRLVEKVPDQVCFLGLKATFTDPEETEACRDVTRRLASVAPDHPITYAAQAQDALLSGEWYEALERIQDSVERLQNAVPQLLLSVMANSAHVAYALNLYQAAAGLNHFVLKLTKFRHSFSLELQEMIAHESQIPHPIKDELVARLSQLFSDQGNDLIFQLSEAGRWRMARDEVVKLVQEQPDNPWAAGMLAVLSGNLGDVETSYREFSRLAEMPGVPVFLAADAIIVAYHLRELHIAQAETTIPRVAAVYQVKDMDRLTEHLLSDRQSIVQSPDPSESREEGVPIPKFRVVFGSHELPRESDDLTYQDFPIPVAHASVFGRQPDREPWVEVHATLTPGLNLQDLVKERLGEYVDGPVEELEATGRSRLDLSGRIALMFPDHFNPMKRSAIVEAAVTDIVTNRWLEEPHPYLHEKTPQEVAHDPAYQARLTAAFVMLQSYQVFALWDGDYSSVWQRLGLQEPSRPTSLGEVLREGLSSFHHVELDDFPDSELVSLFAWSHQTGVIRPLRQVAETIVQRPSLRSEIDLNPIFRQLSEMSWSARTQLRYAEMAREWCQEANQPAGMWIFRGMLAKMNLGEVDTLQQDMDLLMRKHLDEPGVMENLQQLFTMMGITDAQGRPTQEFGGRSEAGQGSDSSSVLWTPDQPAEGSSPPSKLWIPGAE